MTVIAPGLFRTPMSQQLPSCQVPDASADARVFETLRSRNATALASAGDPGEVASAIEDCIRVGEPPARVVVGADGAAMEQTIRQSSAEDLAKLLREFVASLTSEVQSAQAKTPRIKDHSASRPATLLTGGTLRIAGSGRLGGPRWQRLLRAVCARQE